MEKATSEKKEPYKALIVEDEERCTAVYTEVLSKADFVVSSVKDGENAIKDLQEKSYNYDLCLLDYNLPGMSGEDLLEWIKVHASHIAVVMITGRRDEGTVLRCLEKGALDFIEKPVQLDEMPRKLENAIIRQREATEKAGEIHAEVVTDGWVELTAPSEMEYLARMQRFTDILFNTKLPKEICDDIRLTIEEVGRNAIEWGNKFDREKDFKISYCIFSESIVFKFEDEGEGFIPQDLRNPTLDPKAHIKKRKEEGKRPGGFGVYLIQKLMDDVVYNDRGNVVVMTKYFNKGEK
jgi:DNA-binding response OmpR family regulator